MRLLLPSILLTSLLASCAPSSVEGFSRGLAEGLSASTRPQTLICEGSSAGTFTRQTVALTLTVSADGAASGSFQSGTVPYTATGTASLREGVSSPITLTLDSATSGEASVGMSGGWRSIGASGSLGKGSRGLLTGTLSALDTFSGQFRAPLGNYTVSMACAR